MDYRDYIKGDTQVSEIGFGAWQLGIDAGWTTLSEKEAIHLVHKALDLGSTFLILPLYMEMVVANYGWERLLQA